MWVALVVAVILVGLTVAALFGRVDGSLADPTTSLSYSPLPDGPLAPQDVHDLRLATGLRGYRMEQVDEVIDRLTAELAVLRDQIDAARAGAFVPGSDTSEGMPSTSPFVRPDDPAGTLGAQVIPALRSEPDAASDVEPEPEPAPDAEPDTAPDAASDVEAEPGPVVAERQPAPDSQD